MANCDLCGSHCKAIELVELLDGYKIDGVIDICPACKKWADKTKSDLLLEIAPKMRAAIAARRYPDAGCIKMLAGPARPWWAFWRR